MASRVNSARASLDQLLYLHASLAWDGRSSDGMGLAKGNLQWAGTTGDPILTADPFERANPSRDFLCLIPESGGWHEQADLFPFLGVSLFLLN